MLVHVETWPKWPRLHVPNFTQVALYTLLFLLLHELLPSCDLALLSFAADNATKNRSHCV